MDCNHCGSENRPTAKFCGECGRAIKRSCAGCAAELLPSSRFCDQCGTPVGDAVTPTAATAQSAGTDEPAGDAVRKTVTVMFCDLIGSTAFAERVDTETARTVMGRYHDLAQKTIEQHGGTVAKFIGDGVMALWGVPEVAVDDAVSAVQCGAALQESFGALKDFVAETHSVEVGLRVGINTGEVVIASDDADIIGDALNTAARLEAACRPGEVLVGESTWRLTRAELGFGDPTMISVKGKAEPISTFELRSVDTPRAVDSNEHAAAFVGRTAELDRLLGLYRTAKETGTAKLATIIGAPGVGKTRLTEAVAEAIVGDVIVLKMRCRRTPDTPFAPIRDLLVDMGDIRPESDPEEKLRDLLEVFLPTNSERERLAELLGSFVGIGEPRSTEESFFAIRRTMEAVSSSRPILAVVDDIQWADPLFLDLLEHLADWIDGGALLMICLGRPEVRDLRTSLVEEGRRVDAVLTLSGLTSSSTAELAARLLNATSLPKDLLDRVAESTAGNPMFIREFIRMLVADDVLTRDGDSYRLATSVDRLDLPPTIQAILATRIERLPDLERRVLEAASVMGLEFPAGAVIALAPEIRRAQIDDALEQLRRKELLDGTGRYWGDEPIIGFSHALIRDAAYRRLLKTARAKLHLVAGAWLSETALGVRGTQGQTIAHHYEKVYEYRRDLGPLDDDTRMIGLQAAGLLQSEASAALQIDDLAGAAALAQRGLRVIDPTEPLLSDLLLIDCEALCGLGDVAAARRSIDELRTLATDERLDAWVDCFDGQLSIMTDARDLDSIIAMAGRAADRLALLQDEPGVAKARVVRADALIRRGRVADGELDLEIALRAAQVANDRRQLSAVLSMAPLAALAGPTTVSDAGGRCVETLRILRLAGASPSVEIVALRCLAVLEALRGRADSARDQITKARAIADDLGLRRARLDVEMYAGIAELTLREAQAAETYLRPAWLGFRELGLDVDAHRAQSYLARALVEQGQMDEAEQMAIEACAAAGQHLRSAIPALTVRAEVHASRGERDAALKFAHESVELAAETDVLTSRMNAVGVLARVHGALGNSSEAAEAGLEVGRLAALKGLGPPPRPVADAAEPGAEASTTTDAASSSESAGPSNRCSETMRNAYADVTLENIEEVVCSTVSADYERRDLRPGLSADTVTRSGQADALRVLYELGIEMPIPETIAVSGERFALISSHFATDFADGETILFVQEINPAGLIRRTLMYATRQLPEAVAELNRLAGTDIDDTVEIDVARTRFEEIETQRKAST